MKVDEAIKIYEVQKQDKQFRILKDWLKLIFITTAILKSISTNLLIF